MLVITLINPPVLIRPSNSSHSELGSALLDRLCHPLLPGDPDFRSLNDNTKQSLSYLREKLEEIERHNLEMSSVLPQQEAILREFLLYCEFEHRIEKVLLWMQEQGLTKIQGFSHIGGDSEAVKTQVTEFKVFTEKCQVRVYVYIVGGCPDQASVNCQSVFMCLLFFNLMY